MWLICIRGSFLFSEHSASWSFNSTNSTFRFLYASSLPFDVTLTDFFFCSDSSWRLFCFTLSDISSAHSCIKLSSSVFFFTFWFATALASICRDFNSCTSFCHLFISSDLALMFFQTRGILVRVSGPSFLQSIYLIIACLFSSFLRVFAASWVSLASCSSYLRWSSFLNFAATWISFASFSSYLRLSFSLNFAAAWISLAIFLYLLCRYGHRRLLADSFFSCSDMSSFSRLYSFRSFSLASSCCILSSAWWD